MERELEGGKGSESEMGIGVGSEGGRRVGGGWEGGEGLIGYDLARNIRPSIQRYRVCALEVFFSSTQIKVWSTAASIVSPRFLASSSTRKFGQGYVWEGARVLRDQTSV